jgi:hypothetical protein
VDLEERCYSGRSKEGHSRGGSRGEVLLGQIYTRDVIGTDLVEGIARADLELG